MNDRRDSHRRPTGRPRPTDEPADDSAPAAIPQPDLTRGIGREPAVDREEVAAREAGSYDPAPPRGAAPRQDRGDRDSRRGGRRPRRDRPERPPPPATREPPAPEAAEEPESAPEDGAGWWDEIEEELAEAREPDEPLAADAEPEPRPARAPRPAAPRPAAAPPPPPPPPPPPEDDFAAGIFEMEKPAPEPIPEPPPPPPPVVQAAPEPPPPPPEPAPAPKAEPPAPPPPPPPGGVSRRWLEQTWGAAVRKGPERKVEFRTSSGHLLAPLYVPPEARDFERTTGYPGEWPFTRGVQATMYRGRFWTMRQYAGFGSARATNERFRYLLGKGQTGLSVAFDLPTQIGYDSDDPRSEGEIGKVGVPINSLSDMEALLEGIPLDQVSLSMTINSTALVLLLMVAAVAKKQGVPLGKVRGTVQNDMLKEFAARNTNRFSLDAHLRLTTDLFRFSAKNMPEFNMISISGYHMREKGCTAVQEVAFTLANAIAYVEKAVAAGLPVDEFAGRLSFFFAAHNHLFEEVAKFRAARRLWAKIMKQRFGAKDPKSMMLRFHTQTAGSTLTAAQPLTNVVRVALQALAAVLGGTQSLHTNSFDEALGLPSQEAALLALRTQQVIAHESGATDVVDPLGGSPLVEELTDAIERGASEYLAKIDAMGGAVAAIRSGFVTAEIEAAAYRAQQAIEKGEQVVVGVNEYRIEDETPPPMTPVDEAEARRVLEDLAALRRTRDNSRADAALAALEISAAWGDVDLPELVLKCVESYCTIGEICASLETILGAEGAR